MLTSTEESNIAPDFEHPLAKVGFGEKLDYYFQYFAMAFALVTLCIIAWIGLSLFQQSSITRHQFGWSMLTGRLWSIPISVGSWAFIYGSLVSSALSLIIAVPIGVGAAIFLSEIAPTKIANPIGFLIELLAAVPSVIYGLWGLLVMCPWLKYNIYPWLTANFGALPLFSGGGAAPVTMLAAGLILAIMILPFITSVSREVIRSVPRAQREAALGLGATRWEMIRSVVLSAARSGIIGAIILALGRAIGETMAVVMVIGNSTTISASLLDPGYTMPALLANEFSEAFNDPVHRSALLEIALVLFVVTFIVNALARLLIIITTKNMTRVGQASTEHPAMERIRSVGSGILKWLIIGVLTLFLCMQTISDVIHNGAAAIFHPVEMIFLTLIVVRFITEATRKTHNWGYWRKLNNGSMQFLLGMCAMVSCIVLGFLLVYVSVQGAQAMHLSIFQLSEQEGGMKNGLLGTPILVLIASIIGIPFGLIGGIYLSEFGGGKFGGMLRFAADVLNGIPSVVIGMFAYAVFVLPVQHFSAWAGGAALGIMMIPTIMRTTEEMLRLVPTSLREASLGLGATRMRTILSIVLPVARGGVMTGILLAIARIAGETAPLLFTAGGNQLLSYHPNQQISSMTMLIYRFAINGDITQNAMAWSGALILLLLVLIISIISRFAIRNKYALH